MPSVYRSFVLASAGPQYTSVMGVHVQPATREQMQRIGYIYSESRPDLRVNYFLKVQDRQELRSAAPVGIIGHRGWGASSVETVNYRRGTLAIDLVDAQRKALVWRGVAEGRISNTASKNAGRPVGTTVSEIFAGFPNGK